MTIADVVASTTTADALRARPAGFVHDVSAIAGRALRGVPRDLEAVSPPVFIALFFFVVNIATLSKLTKSAGPGFDYKAFQMPTAILLGVTGVSRAAIAVESVEAFNAMASPPRKYRTRVSCTVSPKPISAHTPKALLKVDSLGTSRRKRHPQTFRSGGSPRNRSRNALVSVAL